MATATSETCSGASRPGPPRPPTGGDEDRFDIVVTTDVLAEGVNLQQARHIINYDLPWNPMRLVQRHGRIDRIGIPTRRCSCGASSRRSSTTCSASRNACTARSRRPPRRRREGEILPGSAVSEHNFTETREEIERLRSEDAGLLETGGERGSAFSGEEYRQELRAGLEDPSIRTLVEALPWGSGSGMTCEGVSPGYVFCARVADRPQAIFRWVDDDSGEIVRDTLACLSRATSSPDTARLLPEDARKGAYAAWEAARQDVYESWQHATDPANLQPRVPKAMREAAELLRENPPPEIALAELDRICDAIEAPYGKRIESLIRAAVRSHESPVDRSRAVIATVRELGLEPTPAPKPLPVIELDDVHLVCWLAVVDGDSRS